MQFVSFEWVRNDQRERKFGVPIWTRFKIPKSPTGHLYSYVAFRSFRPGYLASYFRTRNIIFEASLFWFMAQKMRNITFEARLFCVTDYRTRNLT